jgi:hypothetical protein
MQPLVISFYEDNAAAIRIITTGRNNVMRYMGRTHRVCLSWLHERFEAGDFELLPCTSATMCADILTKAFANALKWQAVCELVAHVRVTAEHRKHLVPHVPRIAVNLVHPPAAVPKPRAPAPTAFCCPAPESCGSNEPADFQVVHTMAWSHPRTPRHAAPTSLLPMHPCMRTIQVAREQARACRCTSPPCRAMMFWRPNPV